MPQELAVHKSAKSNMWNYPPVGSLLNKGVAESSLQLGCAIGSARFFATHYWPTLSNATGAQFALLRRCCCSPPCFQHMGGLEGPRHLGPQKSFCRLDTYPILTEVASTGLK